MCCFLPALSFAADTLRLDTPFVRIDLLPYAQLLVDESGGLSVEEVSKRPGQFQSGFKPIQQDQYPEAYWLHITVKALDEVENARIVIPGNAEYDKMERFIDRLDVYLLDDKGQVLSHEKSGYFVPRFEKNIKRDPYISVVPLGFEAGKTYDLLIRMQNIRVFPDLPLHVELRSVDAGLPYLAFPYRWAVVGAWGMFVIIGMYVLIFFYFVRDRSYLYFGIFCLLYSLDLLSHEPAGGISLLIPDHPFWRAPIFYLHLFSLTFLMLFGWHFIGIKKQFPVWHKYYRVVLVLLFGMTLYYFVRNFWPPYQTFQPILFMVFLLFIPFCFRFLFSKRWTARLFGLGFFCFVAGNMVGVAAMMNGLDWAPVAWAVGQIILLFLFAAGLGYQLLESERKRAQANKIQELDELKSRFFTNISHEFRTPLSLILGPLQKSAESVPYSEFQNEKNEVPVPVRHLQVMKRNAQRLKQLVDQILDLSKIEAGKLTLELQKGNIIQFIRNRVAEFESIAESNDINLVASYSEENDNACFDPDKVEKILTNLLSNALKFTPARGEVRVQVLADKNFVKIKVADNGPGMEQTDIDHLFDRFYQSDQAAQQGSGIGMALVKELVQLHKGSISVESQMGEGTAISCRLGIHPDQFAGQDFVDKTATDSHPREDLGYLSETPLSPSDEKPLPAGARLILVVEDHKELQTYIAEILGETYEILVADNGQIGKQMAVEHIPDLIISDVMMPELSGIEMAEQLKREEKTAHIPIILLTAKADRKDKIEGLKTGINDYLTKPFDEKELRLKVDNLLKLQEQWKEKYRQLPWKLASDNINSLDDQFLNNVISAIQDNLTNEYYSVEELGKQIGYSRSQLFRKLKALTGKSPLELIRLQRLHYAKSMLEKGAATVSEVAYQVGYSNHSYFSKSFKEEFGILPSQVKSSN